MSAPGLSIVIPAYNEERRLPATLARVAAYLAPRGDGAVELLVVDDGSEDDTAAIARTAGARVLVHAQNRGKGAAVRTGVLAARGARVLVCDADLATPIEELPRLEAALDAGADLVVGSRHVARARVEVPQPWTRRVLGATFRAMVRVALDLPVRDAMCGFKLLRRETGQAVLPDMRIDRFAFDLELVALAHRGGWRVAEVPVTWRHVGGSTVSPGRDGLRAARDLVALRLRR